MGDYNVVSNTLVSAAAQDALPAFAKTGRGVRITHREYLFDIITSATIGNFNINTLALQPALSSTFPWLSALASQFEEYQLNGVIFEFKSNSYDALASTNTASGTVIMASQYNVLQPVFANKAQMEQYEFSCSCKPSVNLMHPIECQRNESMVVVLSTRNSPVSTGDLRLYDFANFSIATVGMQGASTNIGELWVTYDITLLKPRLGNVSDVMDHFQLGPLANVRTDGSGFGAWGNSPVLAAGSSLGSLLSTNVITIPSSYVGNFAVLYNVTVTTPQAWAVAYFTLSSHISVLNIVGDGPYSTITPQNFLQLSYTSNVLTVMAFYTTTGGGTLTIGTNSVAATAIKEADLYIISLPSTTLS